MGTVVQHLVNGISCIYSTVVVLYIRDSFPSNHYIPVYILLHRMPIRYFVRINFWEKEFRREFLAQRARAQISDCFIPNSNNKYLYRNQMCI